MPRATVNTDATQYDLKTCAEGFVKLRRMSYGEWLTRQDMTMQMQMSGDPSKGNTDLDIKTSNSEIASFEFAHCIVEHNLEDENGNLLTFPQGLSQLDPKVGQEIGELIDELHRVDEGN